MKQKFEELSTCNDVVFGYIEPGHGLKGCQHWITTTDDLKDMYKAYERRKEIIIWCHPSSVSRKLMMKAYPVRELSVLKRMRKQWMLLKIFLNKTECLFKRVIIRTIWRKIY